MIEIPTWKDAKNAVAAGRATPLEFFVWNNEPAGKNDEHQFRQELENLIGFIVEKAKEHES